MKFVPDKHPYKISHVRMRQLEKPIFFFFFFAENISHVRWQSKLKIGNYGYRVVNTKITASKLILRQIKADC